MDPVFLLLFFVGLGLVSGILGGLLGIGGGVVTVPALYFLFHHMGGFEHKAMQLAISTSLAIGALISLLSTLLQLHQKTILFSVLKLLIPGLILGCVIGAFAAHILSDDWLRRIFGVMAIVFGSYFLFPKLPRLQIASAPNRSLSFIGVGIGALATLLGIGGGVITFPILLGYQVPLKNSSATSSFSTCVTCFLGSLSYLFFTRHDAPLPHTFGDINLPALLWITIAALCTTSLGVTLSRKLDTQLIKQIFGGCLALVGLSMF